MGNPFVGIMLTTAGEFATYISGKLISRPDVLTCHPQKLSAYISVLLQMSFS